MSQRADAFRLPFFGWKPKRGDKVYLAKSTPLKQGWDAKIADNLGAGLVRVNYTSQGAEMSRVVLLDSVRPVRRLGPILMSEPMVNAILGGFKVETRRPVVPQPLADKGLWCWTAGRGKAQKSFRGEFMGLNTLAVQQCRYGQPGDLLYVREPWGINWQSGGVIDPTFNYRADGRLLPVSPDLPWWQNWYNLHCPEPGTWQPSIFMPRWASRLVLELESVRFEWAHDITDDAVIAEGLKYFGTSPAQAMDRAHDVYRPGWKRGGKPSRMFTDPKWPDAFGHVWELINGQGTWSEQTLVYVLRFKVWPLDVPNLLTPNHKG